MAAQRLEPATPAAGAARPCAEPASPIVALDAAGKSYQVRGRRNVVFDNLSCQIAAGSFVSIIGPSGCGKSTLLKLVSGLERPDSGRILFRGQPVAGPPDGMIYVFQQYAKSILPWRNVAQNIAFGLHGRRGIGRAEARARCQEYIHLVGLAGYEDHYPAQLSGGMQQRVAIARALIREPAMLLMDEPFSAVDAMTRAILQNLILQLWERLGITILFVTHDVDEAVYLSSEILSLGRAPGGLRGRIGIDLPRPRDQIATREHPNFIALRHQLFASIFAQEMHASSPDA